MAFYGILKAGGVVVAINPQYKQPELVYQISDSGAEILFGLGSAYDLLRAVQKDTALRTLILTNPEDGLALPGWSSGKREVSQSHFPLEEGDVWLDDFLTTHPNGALQPQKVSAQDVAVFQYSGGTTGISKGAIALHRNLVANSLMFRAWLVGLKEGEETTLMAIPMYHVYGMVVGMSVSILLRAKMVLIPDPRNLPGLLSAIEKYHTTFFPGVPTMYAMINQNPDVQAGKYQLRSISACISGSAPLLKEIKDRFESLTGAQLMEGYGLSEAPTATHCNPMFGEKRTGSIGLPLPDVECRIVDLEDGTSILPPGSTGELVLRSPQVMKGYHNRSDETDSILRDGWLYTGDIAWMDEDGYFYLVDRKKDLIKVSGFQVWPREIEEVIASIPGVREVSAAGIPDPIRGEVPKAWVVLKPGVELTVNEIRGRCAEMLVYYKVPAEVEFIESLPRTTVGKILRRELVRQHQEGK